MPFLIDTMIISELRRKNRAPQVADWFHSVNVEHLFLSVITIGEIENGIVKQRRINPKFSDELSQWLEALLSQFDDHILAFSTPISRRWGRLCGELGRADADFMIAATALEHDLTVATRNVNHFKTTGVSIVNPFDI